MCIMMKSLVLFLILFVFGGCYSSSDKKLLDEDLEEILIDPEKVAEYLDLSEILNDSIDIVPLETTEKCLISEIIQIEFYKDKIYVSDKANAKIFVFTTAGNFLKSIGKQGLGPGEYSYLGGFSFKGDSIVIQDLYRNKYVVYDLYSDSYREIPYDVYHEEIVSFDNTAYLISNYYGSSYGSFNLFKFDFRTSKVVSPELSFDKKYMDRSRYMLRRYASKCGDAATLIYPLNDTIYTLKEDVVYPSYIIHFTSRNLPEGLDVDKDMLFRFVRKNRYLKGFEYLQNSQDYLLGYYSDDSFKYFIYDKRNTSIHIGKWLKIGLLGNMIFHYFYTVSDSGLCILQDADIFSSNWKSMKAYCSNRYYREKMDSIVDKLNDDSNPILLMCKFRRMEE